MENKTGCYYLKRELITEDNCKLGKGEMIDIINIHCDYRHMEIDFWTFSENDKPISASISLNGSSCNKIFDEYFLPVPSFAEALAGQV